MIDIENKVIDNLSQAFDGVAKVSGVFVESPAEFPWVYAREISNSEYQRSIDNDLHDHHASVTFRVEYYSAARVGAKQEIKALAQIGDIAMQNMKFTRTFYQPLPNLDRTIFRITMRWEAIAGEPVITTTTGTGNETVTTTTYQMYRE